MERKIKILYTIPNFDTAGSGKVLFDLANSLNRDMFDVEIACNNAQGSFFKEVEKLRFPIHIIATTVNLRPFISLPGRLYPFRDLIRSRNVDIVHSWNWSSDWTEVIASKLGGAKFVYTKKAMSWGNIHWKIKSYLSDFIVTINEEMRSYFPWKRMQKLIPIGIDINYYNCRSTVVKSHQCFKIITVANLVPVKGIEVLIKAIKILDNPKFQLEVLGDDRDSYANDLKELVVELDLTGQITFLGKHLDVRPFIENSDLYVIPTLNSGRKEGMPMALVEAMLMQLPVLGSNISGINFVLKDFQDLLFEASNAEELSSKILFYSQKPDYEREKLGYSLRKYCIENFSMDKFVKEHESLYLRLFGK